MYQLLGCVELHRSCALIRPHSSNLHRRNSSDRESLNRLPLIQPHTRQAAGYLLAYSRVVPHDEYVSSLEEAKIILIGDGDHFNSLLQQVMQLFINSVADSGDIYLKEGLEEGKKQELKGTYIQKIQHAHGSEKKEPGPA